MNKQGYAEPEYMPINMECNRTKYTTPHNVCLRAIVKRFAYFIIRSSSFEEGKPSQFMVLFNMQNLNIGTEGRWTTLGLPNI